jgi:hypothetical protein
MSPETSRKYFRLSNDIDHDDDGSSSGSSGSDDDDGEESVVNHPVKRILPAFLLDTIRTDAGESLIPNSGENELDR